MNTHLIMYITAQEHARRNAQTWQHPSSRAARSRDAGRVWRKLRTRLQHSGATQTPATGFTSTGVVVTTAAGI